MRNAMRWPVLVLATAICGSACVSLKLEQALSVLGDQGAYVTKAKLGNDVLHYELVSIHPGSDSPLDCVSGRGPGSDGIEYVVHDCADAGSATETWISRFRDANDYLHDVVPGLRVTRLEVTLLPVGVENVLRAEGAAPPGRVHLQLAFRFHDEPRYMRHAIRSYAHEYLHLGLRATGSEQLEDEEYIAAVAESCVEERVFGSANGPAFGDPSSFDVSGMTKAQQESVRAAALAYRDARRELARAGSLDSICANLFSGLD
jgi:hypothetical protein